MSSIASEKRSAVYTTSEPLRSFSESLPGYIRMLGGIISECTASIHEGESEFAIEPVFTEGQLSESVKGRSAQFDRVIGRILAVFENIEPGQTIEIDGNRYILSRRLDYCEPGFAGWRKDWAYRLAREDNEIIIYTYYHHNSPQNYMMTEKLSYNGVIETSSKDTLMKIKGAFEGYFNGEKDLPL